MNWLCSTKYILRWGAIVTILSNNNDCIILNSVSFLSWHSKHTVFTGWLETALTAEYERRWLNTLWLLAGWKQYWQLSMKGDGCLTLCGYWLVGNSIEGWEWKEVAVSHTVVIGCLETALTAEYKRKWLSHTLPVDQLKKHRKRIIPNHLRIEAWGREICQASLAYQTVTNNNIPLKKKKTGRVSTMLDPQNKA